MSQRGSRASPAPSRSMVKVNPKPCAGTSSRTRRRLARHPATCRLSKPLFGADPSLSLPSTRRALCQICSSASIPSARDVPPSTFIERIGLPFGTTCH